MLSVAQERLWILEKLRPGTRSYCIPLVFKFEGPLDTAALHLALCDVVERHDVLRSVFTSVNGRPHHAVKDDFVLPWSVVDVSALAWSEVLRRAEEEMRTDIDLSAGPLKACVLRISPVSHIFVVLVHHIVFDGWSRGIFMRELTAFYEARRRGEVAVLPPLLVKYSDFARWQRDWLSGERHDELLGYWCKHLAGAPPVLKLPTDRPRPVVQSFRGAHEYSLIPGELLKEVREMCTRERVTMFMAMLAAFKVVLARYSGQHDVIVGTPIANRTRTEFEPLIGFFMNTLVLRTDLSGDPTASEVLGRVRDVALDAYEYQDLPFAELVKELRPPRNPSWAPVTQVMFTLANAPGHTPELQGVTIEPIGLETGVARFDMSLILSMENENAQAMLEYSTDLFDPTTARRTLDDYVHVLTTMAQVPHARMSQLL